jgi:hypothetical protein
MISWERSKQISLSLLGAALYRLHSWNRLLPPVQKAASRLCNSAERCVTQGDSSSKIGHDLVPPRMKTNNDLSKFIILYSLFTMSPKSRARLSATEEILTDKHCARIPPNAFLPGRRAPRLHPDAFLPGRRAPRLYPDAFLPGRRAPRLHPNAFLPGRRAPRLHPDAFLPSKNAIQNPPVAFLTAKRARISLLRAPSLLAPRPAT